ncbi:MAG: ribosomal RNA small subunit methyltransferase A [Proteobacteria bacterium]|nr:ribosomal RNA small subunit methyltransferase A [Pseudomonadota bacterium]
MRFSPPYAQHFLHDRNILSAIVSAGGLSRGAHVVEIGVGTGRLTEQILAAGAVVTGVEVDPKLLPALREKFGHVPDFRLVEGDILGLDWMGLFPAEGKVVIMGNLPYSLSSQVLFRAISFRERIERAVFLLQWEVGVRMAASPGSKDYGILSVACQMFGKPSIVRKVPPSVFLPPPKVDSSLMRWDLFAGSAYPLEDEFFTMKVIRAAFGQRRKKLINSVTGGMPQLEKEPVREILRGMGLGEMVRAEELSVGQFAELSNRLYEARHDDGETR